jgi:hypothetical protein
MAMKFHSYNFNLFENCPKELFSEAEINEIDIATY